MKIGYLLQEGVPDIRKRPPSGAANHVVQVILELQKAGHAVRLLAKLDGRLWRSDDLETFIPVQIQRMDQGIFRLVERGIRRIQSALKLPFANYFNSLRFAYACRQELSDCDLYYERMGWLGYGGGIAAQWQKIPLVLEVNGDHLGEFHSQGLRISRSQQTLSIFLMKKAARRVSHVVATGEGWRQKYIERWRADPSKVSVVENGSSLVDILQRGELRSFDNILTDSTVNIAYCGGFEPWHGIPILIHASRRVIEQGGNIHLTLIGSGSEKEKIKNIIQEMGLEIYFSITDQVSIEELARYLAQSDIGVSPYCGRVEYSGLKLLDYKAAGLATIASGQAGQPASLEHGKTGWIVPPCDENALSEAILFLSANPHHRRNIGQQARIEAEEIHSWQYTVQQLSTIFIQATNR